MCWYTDSLDNSFVIDYVPEYSDSLFIATGGSGHGFKFLPVLGKHVRNALEKQEDQFTKLWRWRLPNKARVDDRQQLDLSSLQMATEEDWQWTKTAKAIVDRVDMGRERARL
jgi:sarcosine oxidase/L-pipecolate oxidase